LVGLLLEVLDGGREINFAFEELVGTYFVLLVDAHLVFRTYMHVCIYHLWHVLHVTVSHLMLSPVNTIVGLIRVLHFVSVVVRDITHRVLLHWLTNARFHKETLVDGALCKQFRIFLLDIASLLYRL
jgi:hypothetical protein